MLKCIAEYGASVRTAVDYLTKDERAIACDLATLRDLATSWARRYVDRYQVAIYYYHDDNGLRIPTPTSS